MSVTATYNQITSTTNTWIGTFQIGGVYYAIKDPNLLYRIETNGTATYLRAIAGNVWGDVCCDGTYIYRASSTTILKINPADGTVPYSSACANLRCLGIDTAGARIFGLTNSGALYVFTLNNMTQYYVNNVGSATYGGKMVYLNGALYIPTYGGKIKKYVVDTGVTSTLNNSLSAGWLCLDTDGQYIYGTVDGGRIYRIYPDDSATYEEVQGDSAGRFWYSNTYYNGQIWANAYNGYCYKIALPVPAVPTSSLTTSTIYTDTAVTLSCSTSGATIKYTLDGTTPSATNGTTYSSPFTILRATTIKFCAIKDGYLTAGVDAVISYGGSVSNVISSSLANDYMQLCWNNGILYGAANYSTINTINTSNGTATLLITCPSTIRSFEIISNKILVLNSDYLIREYDLSGNLVATHTLLNTSALQRPIPYCNFFTFNSIVYASMYDNQDYKYLYPLTLGSNESVSYSISRPNDYGDGYGIVVNSDFYNINLYNKNLYISKIVHGVSGSNTILNKDISFFGVTANSYITDITYDNYRIFIHIEAIGIIVVNLTDLSVTKMWNSESCATMVATSTGIYLNNCTTNNLIFIKTYLDLGTPSIYNSGSWKTEKSLYVRNNSTWKLANKAFKVKNGLWTRIY